jgi:hypothetical protein
LPTNPNELEEIVECRFCDAVLCSSACAADHETLAHPDDADVTPGEDVLPA